MWLRSDKIYSIINKDQSVLDIPLTVKCGQVGQTRSLAVENALAARKAAGVSALHAGRTQEQIIQGMRILRPFTRLPGPN